MKPREQIEWSKFIYLVMGLEFSGSCFLNYFYLKIYKIFYLKNIFFLKSTHKIIKKHKNKNILIF